MHRGWFFNITMGCTTERMSATCRISIILNSPHLYLDHTFTDWTTNVLQSMPLGLSFAMFSFVPLFYVLVQTSLGCLLNSFVFYLPLFHVLEGFTLALATVAIVLTSDRLFKMINNFRWNRYSMKTYTFATKQMPQCTNERVSSLTICVSVCLCVFKNSLSLCQRCVVGELLSCSSNQRPLLTTRCEANVRTFYMNCF